MFSQLSSKIQSIFDSIRGKGVLTESDVDSTLREIRLALIEADVSLKVAKDFINDLRTKLVGAEIVKSVSPGQMVVKLVNDALVELLQGDSQIDTGLDLASTPPVPIMLVGLQGTGKTTTTAKLALWLRSKQNKKVLMVSLDMARPAAQDQLISLGKQVDIDVVEKNLNSIAQDIAEKAMKRAKQEGYDVVLFDTAGRLHTDNELMEELKVLNKIITPKEILLVVDALTGQDAVNIAEQFHSALPLTGVILTRVEGDSRGGAALSMRAITHCPIKFIGVGEKLPDLEFFNPPQIASRILGMGDVVSLVEKAQELVNEEDVQKLEKKIMKGNFDLNDLQKQLRFITKMGGISDIVKMIPGAGRMLPTIDASHENMVKKQIAIIDSMTKKERRTPDIISSSRKIRIAKGSGVDVAEINKLLKSFMTMNNMVRKISRVGDKKSAVRSAMQALSRHKLR